LMINALGWSVVYVSQRERGEVRGRWVDDAVARRAAMKSNRTRCCGAVYRR